MKGRIKKEENKIQSVASERKKIDRGRGNRKSIT